MRETEAAEIDRLLHGAGIELPPQPLPQADASVPAFVGIRERLIFDAISGGAWSISVLRSEVDFAEQDQRECWTVFVSAIVRLSWGGCAHEDTGSGKAIQDDRSVAEVVAVERALDSATRRLAKRFFFSLEPQLLKRIEEQVGAHQTRLRQERR